MKVYVVMKCYPYEGERLCGIYDSLEKANSVAEAKAKSDFSWEYEEDKVKFKKHEDGTFSYEAYDMIYSEIWDVE